MDAAVVSGAAGGGGNVDGTEVACTRVGVGMTVAEEEWLAAVAWLSFGTREELSWGADD